VFYSIGFVGMTYCVDVITADASKLKNRGLAYAFTSSPYLITAFAGSKAAEDFYEKISWRWGFGCFAIIFPIVAAPLYFVLKFNLRKAQKEGVLASEKSNRTLLQSIWFYTIEFDGGYNSPLLVGNRGVDDPLTLKSTRSGPVFRRPHRVSAPLQSCC
jgi:MFS family permease